MLGILTHAFSDRHAAGVSSASGWPRSPSRTRWCSGWRAAVCRSPTRSLNVFDIPLLAKRLVAATRWARGDAEVAELPVGYFGASTGAGAALWAAADLGEHVRAVVSRGGRPDLAAPRLHDVRAPVLLIVGGQDDLVLELNHEARDALPGPCDVAIVPGATQLFEEPGALDEVARLASHWFERHVTPTPTPTH